MPLFWTIALLLALATVVALTWPLLRHSRAAGLPDDAARDAVFRDQKRQIEDDHAAGVTSDAERNAALKELVERLGREIETSDATGSEPRRSALDARRAWIAALVIVALFPAAAFVLYLTLGKPDAIGNAATQAAARPNDREIVAMVERLAQTMRDNPADPKGWMLLARSYTVMGRYAEAADAYEHAAALTGDDASLLADWADALGMAQGQRLAGKPTELIQRALKLDPKHPKSLALAASAAAERNDVDGAIAAWKTLLTVIPPDSEDAREFRQAIADAEAARGPASSASAAPSIATSPAPGASALAEQMAAATRPAPPAASSLPATAPTSAPTPPAAAPGAAIRGRVQLAPSLAAKASPDDTVFIFARPAQGARMPLAALRRNVRDLPLDFALDDSMAMTPQAKLSTAGDVVVEARISKSGNALPAAGDLRGMSATTRLGSSGVNVTIDSTVP